MSGTYVPHEAVYVEQEDEFGVPLVACTMCGLSQADHPEFWDVDVPLEDDYDDEDIR